MLRRLALGLALGAAALPAQAADPNAEINRAWAAGYRAAFTCSALWNGAGKPLDAIERDELTGIYPEIEADVRALKADIDEKTKIVSVKYRNDMPPRIAMWDRGEGCVTLPIGASPGRVEGFLNHGRPMLDDQLWPLGDKDAARPRPRSLTAVERATIDMESFGGRSSSLLIVKNGRIAVERYWLGHDLHTAQRTFSVAKSMAATLVGNAAYNGWIDVTAPAMIAEWQSPGDPRAKITTNS